MLKVEKHMQLMRHRKPILLRLDFELRQQSSLLTIVIWCSPASCFKHFGT